MNKAPLIINLCKTQSAAGLSLISVYTETIMFVNAAAYGMLEGYPLSVYGENVCLFLQNCIVIGIAWHYLNRSTLEKIEFLLSVTIYVVFVTFFLSPERRYLLQTSNYAILLYSGGKQIIMTQQVKHTGAQSLVSILLGLFGALARTFTTMKETNDETLLIGYCLGAVMGGVGLFQYQLYRKNTERLLQQYVSSAKEPEDDGSMHKKKEL